MLPLLISFGQIAKALAYTASLLDLFTCLPAELDLMSALRHRFQKFGAPEDQFG
jgi:hypothetical protein